MSMDDRVSAVLSDEHSRLQDESVLEANVEAATAIGDAVETTLGPKGMDKLLIDSIGGIVVTNDGATILEEIDIEHPTAQMIADVARTQNQEFGDGTTTATILSCELLDRALELVEKGVHPSTIAAGYTRAAAEATTIAEQVSIPSESPDIEAAVETSVAGRRSTIEEEYLTEIVLQAVDYAKVNDAIDPDRIQVEIIPGGKILDSEVINGVVIEQSPSNPSMPTRVDEATVSTIDGEITAERPDVDTTVVAESAGTMDALATGDRERLTAEVDHVLSLGVDVLLVSGDVDSWAMDQLTQSGLLVVKQCPEEALAQVANATGASIIAEPEALREQGLGVAGSIEVGGTEHRSLIFIEECESPGYVTLLLRGGTEHVLDEATRIVTDGIASASVSLEDQRVCVGGGATEMEVASRLKRSAKSVSGREQLAVTAFSEAVESIPRSLASNAGQDPVDALIQLRNDHANGSTFAGINVSTAEIEDLRPHGIVDPLSVKQAAITSATEAANMIIRIDDMVMAEQLPDEQGEMA